MQKIGIVVRRTKSFYYVDVGKSKPLFCRIRGKLFSENTQQNIVAVGDKVELDQSIKNKLGLILKILPRRTKFSRRNKIGEPEQILASNADSLIMVASIKSPPFRAGLLDRFLVAGSCGGMETFLILSKTDLVSYKEIKPITELYSSLGCTVILSSAYESKGLNKIKKLIQNKTSILSGHSGVGKSSLISALFPQWDIRIGKINEKSGKGRHTTIMAEMFRLPHGGYIIDTPGIRSFQPNVTRNELDSHFVDFSPYLGECKFKSCTHPHEPLCKIKEAVTKKKITPQRYKSYCSLFDSL